MLLGDGGYVCEPLAQGRYVKAKRPEINHVTSWWRIKRLNHYNNMPHCYSTAEKLNLSRAPLTIHLYLNDYGIYKWFATYLLT